MRRRAVVWAGTASQPRVQKVRARPAPIPPTGPQKLDAEIGRQVTRGRGRGREGREREGGREEGKGEVEGENEREERRWGGGDGERERGGEEECVEKRGKGKREIIKAGQAVDG